MPQNHWNLNMDLIRNCNTPKKIGNYYVYNLNLLNTNFNWVDGWSNSYYCTPDLKEKFIKVSHNRFWEIAFINLLVIIPIYVMK